MNRSVSVLCALGALLAVAVGPGVSLIRCSLTGRVSIDCCCEPVAAEPAAALATRTPGCCTVQDLSAPWTSAQAPSGPGPTTSVLFASSLVFAPIPAAVMSAVPAPLAASPPDRPLPLRI